MAFEPLTLRSLGIASAAGPSAKATMQRLATGDSLLMRHDAFFDVAYDPLSCIFADTAEIDTFETRSSDLAVQALRDCLTHEVPTEPVDMVVLLPESDDLSAMPKDRVVRFSRGLHMALMACADEFSIEISTFHFINQGRAGLGMALQRAALNGGRDCIIVGGESYSDRLRLSTASRNGMLFSARDKWGFIPGEAGGAVWVSALPSDSSKSLILGVGSDVEEITERNVDMPSDHSGLSRAVRKACECGTLPGKITRWLSDANNSRYQATELAYAIHRAMAFWLSEQIDTVHVPMTFGECGVGFGFLALMGACNRPEGSVTLISSSALDGNRAAFIAMS